MKDAIKTVIALHRDGAISGEVAMKIVASLMDVDDARVHTLKQPQPDIVPKNFNVARGGH